MGYFPCIASYGMADTGQNIQALAKYLDVKCGKITYDGLERLPVYKGKTGTRKGLATISKHLARAAEKTSLLGETAEERAIVDQWLEYRVCQLERCPSEKDLHNVLKDLNCYLAANVFFVGHKLTLIDLIFFYGLHPVLMELPFHDKQKFPHVSRWFNNVQQVSEVRQFLPEVTFSKTVLYSGSAH